MSTVVVSLCRQLDRGLSLRQQPQGTPFHNVGGDVIHGADGAHGANVGHGVETTHMTAALGKKAP